MTLCCWLGFPSKAFETFHNGSWEGIEQVRIKCGSIIVQFVHHGYGIEENVIPNNIRLRSRMASISDCRCFLRPGIDVCIFSAYPNAINSTQENLQSAWRDAKIISIDRKPHEYKCTCQFSVSFYRDQDQDVSVKKKSALERGSKEVAIDNIAILQKPNRKCSEDGWYQWSSFEDCRSANESKLFSGILASEIAWLFVISTLKGSGFDVILMHNKIVYLILNGDRDDDIGSKEHESKSHDMVSNNVKAISFQRCNGFLQPRIETFALHERMIVPSTIIEANPIHYILENELHNEMNNCLALRRPKRQKVPVDNFVSYDCFSKSKRLSTKSRKNEINRWKEKEAASPIQLPSRHDLLLEADNEFLIEMSSLKLQNEGEQIAHSDMDDSNKFEANENSRLRHENIYFDSMQQVWKIYENHQEVKSTCERTEEDKGVYSNDKSKFYPRKRNKKCHGIFTDSIDIEEHHAWHMNGVEFSFHDNAIPSSDISPGSPLPDMIDSSAELVPRPNMLLHANPVLNQDGPFVKIQENHAEKISKNYSKHHSKSNTSTKQRKRASEINDMEFPSLNPNDPDNYGYRDRAPKDRAKKKGSHKYLKGEKAYSNSYQSNSPYPSSKTKRGVEARIYSKNLWQMIEGCMKKIEYEMDKQDPLVSQWEANQVINKSNQRMVFNWTQCDDDCVESPEHNDLWKEMDNSISSHTSLKAGKESSIGFSDFTTDNSCKGNRQPCDHEYKLDEQVGLICHLCNIVSTEIKYVLPPIFQGNGWIRIDEQCNGNNLVHDREYDLGLNPFINAVSSNTISVSEQYDNVWTIIPEFRLKLHAHQKKAFEFLWKNIAGTLNPRDMKIASVKLGGCVISHSPGTGKTLLVISFLVSYLKLYPRKRPLILAPKTTLYAWYKEFEKWEVSVPIYQIHSRRNYKKEIQSCGERESVGDLKLNLEMMHIMDCLDKLRKWHEHPSVLLMSYPSFSSLTQGNSKSEHRRYMAGVLRQNPGILILDEGHNPRSTKSKLRKALMEVKTDLRILLSGTLFQNNFEEYFNTLCLARPSFISELAKEFYPKMAIKRVRKPREKIGRRFFVENIAKRINSSVEEDRKVGLDMLRKVTNGFIDAYDGKTLDMLPGLQSYTLLMKSTDVQQDILSRLQQATEAKVRKGYALELELLITVGSMHPWLIKTVASVTKYFSTDELEDLDKYKFDINKGPKVKFVIDLVQHCIIRREKVLIFCRNIPPINLFVEIFKMVFGWQKGEEVLVLQGELDLCERAKVLDKFKERGGASRVLLASTTACAEGISLTAASRVVLLDSEWNPSKTKQAIARAFRPGQEKVVYVYRLLASGTLEEEKYGRTALKELQSRMIFTGGCLENSSYKETENIDDEVLRELVKEDRTKAFEMILKHEKVSNNMGESNEEAALVLPE
ncbi:SNF2 domain-containing protein CLASSY 1-like isoform X2 [Tasmannia lanceolata]|uniref:SNF2 domain-containing protein CLASSY 1-like isoform X2 n=1 Tax=Tasmannia lanceolata TaxID=3420 RepID=UPI0040649647